MVWDNRMLKMVLCLLVLVFASHASHAAAVESILQEGGAVDRGLGALMQVFLWADPFTVAGRNHALNLFVGSLEALAGTVLISSGWRQINYTNPADGEGLRRVARRTTGEVVKTLLGHFLRLAGVARGAAGLLLIIGSLL
jgi:hypothetical protein